MNAPRPFAAAVALAIGTFCLATQAANHTVTIVDFSFNPASLQIAAGDTVTWVNDGSFTHTTTSGTTSGGPNPDGVWDSGALNSGASYSHTFPSAGTFPYYCAPHYSFMTGSITVSAANVPPTVAITNPPSGTIIPSGTPVTIRATASDSDGRVVSVQFMDSLVSLGVVSNAPYSITATLSSGIHSISAIAKDDQGASTRSQVVTITVGQTNAPPAVAITSPTNGAAFPAGATIRIQANASDSDGSVSQVEFFDGATSLGAITASPFNLNATLASGSHMLTAVATDNQGATNSSAMIMITVASNILPTVSIASPTNNTSFISPASVNVQINASDSDGSIMEVVLFNASNAIATLPDAPFVTNATLFAGTNTLVAVAMDNLGGMATSAPVAVIVGTIPIPDPLPNRIPKGDVTIELATIATNLTAPIGMAQPDDGSGRLFVYDQAGEAWVVNSNGARLPTPLLDVRGRLMTLGFYDERGLLGLAVHPDFANHPLIYTFTSEPTAGVADFPNTMPSGITNDHQSVIAEWRINPANSNQVDPASRREVLRIDKPESNHNGGTLRFGPDNFLYFVTGDGGNANDVGNGHVPGGNAQNLHRIYGKMLRIDVDGNNSSNGKYGIPANNPFVGQDALPEIFAYGLRNPFSFSFDTATGQLYAGDVGQNTVEEVDVIAAGGNYGWNIKEGGFWFDSITTNIGDVVTGPVRPVPPGLTDPIAQYDHGDGHAIIGGFIYHGTQIPALQGRYVFGDWGYFTTPTARLFYLDATGVIKEFRLGLADRPTGFWVRGFGQDAAGEIYVFTSTILGPNGTTGAIYKNVAPPLIVHVAIADANSVNLTLEGGVAPFQVQRKVALSDAVWQNVTTTSSRIVNLPNSGATAFFRVLDAAQ